MVNAGKWCVKIKWRRCQYTIAQRFCVPSLVFPTFSDFKVVYHEHRFAFPPSAVSVMPLSQERILWWSYLRLDQSVLRLAEYDDVIRGAPLFSLASGPPNPKPTTGYDNTFYIKIFGIYRTT